MKLERLKVMTIVGTRPEVIRLSAVIKKCDRYFNHVLVHTGQNWDHELNQIFFEELGIRRPDYYLDAAGENLGNTIGKIISKSYDVLLKEKPDALLILGDTNSALCAIPAKRLKIPIFHMEAGNRCFDKNVPEEINRKIVDHISDINLPYTENSRRYLLAEGISKEHIFVTGSPMPEVINQHRAGIDKSTVLEELGLRQHEYILLSAHREENIDDEDNFIGLMTAVNETAGIYGMPIIYSMHPRSQGFIEKRGFKFNPLVRPLKPFGFFNYCRLQTDAFCVLSDSGTLAEESAILGFPAVSIRTSTERPEAIDNGTMILGGIEKESVIQAIELCVLMHENKEFGSLSESYMDENVSVKVVKIIQSYTGIINKFVWRK